MPSLLSVPFRGRIQDGKLCLENRDAFAARVASLDGKDIELILRKHRKVRSLSANRFYWGPFLDTIAESTGDNKEALHEHFKKEIVPLGERSVLGVQKTESTAEMESSRFWWYIDQVRALVAQFEITCPAPIEFEN